MAIEIGGIELTNIHRVTTLENGNYIQHNVPGLDGELRQDIGRQSLMLQIDGIFYGENITKELKALREIYLQREPTELLAQITGQAYAAKVLIDSLRVMESGEQVDQYSYQMIVVEYIEPPASGGINTNAVDAAVSLEAVQIMDIMELPDMLSMGSIPELSNPLEPLKDCLTPVQEASSAFMDAASGLKALLG